VTSLNASDFSGDHETMLIVEVQNVGEVPAVDVRIKVSDSGGLFENSDLFLGAIFPGKSTSIWFQVPEFFTYAPDKELSHLAPVSLEERQRLNLKKDAEEYIQEYPEGHEATMVTCHITYREPLRLPLKHARAFKTIQPFHVDHRGRFQPARSKQAKIT
jgi:hypothetical protein